MTRATVAGVTALAVAGLTVLAEGSGRRSTSFEVVTIRSGGLTLGGQVWRPAGHGQFPAVLFNHGSYGADDPLPPTAPQTIGPVFARHGYVFLWLHRQGIGMSKGQGIADGDQMARALRANGVDGRNRVQLRLLEYEELDEAVAALDTLRERADVDTRRVVLVGHSFGGALTILMAAADPGIRAAVVFGAAAASWDRSPLLGERLLAAVGRMPAAAFFIHAENDYSTAPGRALATEMRRLAKPHALKIYPPFGPDPRAGHNFIFQSVRTWESDVFAFLDEHLRR
jgi:dienelactone hydrolase